MHGGLASNAKLLAALAQQGAVNKQMDCAVCVPFPYLFQAQALLGSSEVKWGAQNVSAQAQGAFTGEVSAGMLKDFGCAYALVGHSERRQLYGESSEQVAAKYAAVLNSGIVPILCVGETLPEREAGQTESVVGQQLDSVIKAVGVEGLARGMLAYEPVWAIGTGKTASPEQAQAVHVALRTRVAAKDRGVAEGLRILYGGSVKAANAADLFAQQDIDGGLIGGASLQADEFLSICMVARPKAR